MPTTGRSARSASRRAPRSARAPSSSPAATSGRSRWSVQGPSSPTTVPAHALVAGNPARRIGWVCVCGDRLRRLERSRRPPPSRERYATTRSSSCPACDRRYALRRRRRRAPRASGRVRHATERRHDPGRAPGHRARGDRRRHRGPRERDARRRQARRRARGALGRRSSAPSTRIAVSNGTVALMCIFEGLGLGPGDEVITVGHTFNATVSAILFDRRDAGLRRHRARHLRHRRRPDRGGDHAPDAGHLPGPPVRPAGRHGRDRGHRRPSRPRGRRGRLPGPRRRVRAAGGSAASGTGRSACTARRT